jgi:UDP-4-amino-4-deoxy-L-arabinose-oxoglutarate aminotransferase
MATATKLRTLGLTPRECEVMRWIGEGKRDRVISELQKAGVGVMVNYRAIHLLSYFSEAYGFKPGDFPVAESIGDSTISLPFYPNMPLEDVDRVIEVLREILV